MKAEKRRAGRAIRRARQRERERERRIIRGLNQLAWAGVAAAEAMGAMGIALTAFRDGIRRAQEIEVNEGRNV